MLTILRIYGRALARLPGDIGKQPWILVLPVVYTVALSVCTQIVGFLFRGALGILGGFALGFVVAALAASFLYFLDEVVTGSPVHLREFPRSFQRYLWPVVNVLFVFWIAQIVLGLALSHAPLWLELGIGTVLGVMLNATPEVIYQRRIYSGLEVLMGSVAFIQENWIEWFIPNLPLGALLVLANVGIIRAPELLYRVAGPWAGSLVWDLVQAAFLLVFFIFRGHLFAALDGSSRRQRKFQYGR